MGNKKTRGLVEVWMKSDGDILITEQGYCGKHDTCYKVEYSESEVSEWHFNNRKDFEFFIEITSLEKLL